MRLRGGASLALLAIFAVSAPAIASITINAGQPVFADAIPFVISGTSDAEPGTSVTVTIESVLSGAPAPSAALSPGNAPLSTTVAADHSWTVSWTSPLPTGTYAATVKIGTESATQDVRVQLAGDLPRQSGVEAPPARTYARVETLAEENYQEMTDRWRITPPPYELDEQPKGRKIGSRGGTLDPYNRNLFKGDFPIYRNYFLVLTGISDTLAESRTLPTPSGVSAARPSSFRFFGKDNQSLFNQNLTFSGDVFQGDTAFQPIAQRLKITLIANMNRVKVEENAIVKPDVRRGTTRTDGRLSLQEFFYERKLGDLSPNYDFLSVRVGSQPFTSDFRGFIFSDTNLGVRLFGNYASNRFQYNLAAFDRLEKDTNSGLNTLERRGQKVGIANFYWQDFLVPGYTQQFSIHHVRDDASFKYDRNGILVRPAPVGVFTPHEVDATYIGQAGLGHVGRWNLDHALYFVFGRDSLNPIAGPDPRLRDRDSVRIAAASAALEVSYDHDWYRPRAALFYASGDRNPRDRTARGFDSIFDATAFAGGGFSFFNRLGIRLAGTGVSLVERGSLLPALRSSKDEGQPNYVNPGIQLASVGVDIDVTPRFKAIVTANYIRLDATESVQEVLFQGGIRKSLGEDISLGLRYRPFLSQNVVLVGGTAVFLPGTGFKDIYESGRALYHVFTNVILTF